MFALNYYIWYYENFQNSFLDALAYLVLYFGDGAHYSTVPVFVSFDFIGKNVPAVFCFSSSMGENHFVRNGFLLHC